MSAVRRFLRDFPAVWRRDLDATLAVLDTAIAVERALMVAGKQKYAPLLDADELTRRRLAVEMRRDVSWNVLANDVIESASDIVEGMNSVREVAYLAAGGALCAMRSARAREGVRYECRVTKAELSSLRAQQIQGRRLDWYVRKALLPLAGTVRDIVYAAFTGPSRRWADVTATIRRRVATRYEQVRRELATVFVTFAWQALRTWIPQFVDARVQKAG